MAGDFPFSYPAFFDIRSPCRKREEKMKEHSLTNGSIFRSLLTFAVPVFLALFLQAMYGAADLIIVG